LSTDPIDLKSLCGFYCIVYDEYTDTENSFDSQNGDAYNYLRLSVDPGAQDNESPAKISASFRLFDKIGTSGPLVREEGETANYWDMDEVEWSEVPEDDEDPGQVDEDDLKKRQRFGHGIAILKTLDDRGYPFIQLIYNVGPRETDSHRGDLIIGAIGKKQKHDRGSFGLTPSEADRLMEDGVEAELVGDGWEQTCDSECEDHAESEADTSPVASQDVQDESPEDTSGGKKRKAEDDVEDSERRSVVRKN
jgi:hypothetical protein